MKRRYTYDCVLTHEPDGWVASFPQIPEAYSDGDTPEEAIRNASEALELALAGRIEDGQAMPKYERCSEIVAISVELTDEVIEEMHYETLSQAAEDLEVSPSRITALMKSGTLESRYFDGVRKVSIESVNRYRNAPRKAGRPKAASQGKGEDNASAARPSERKPALR